MGYLTIIHNACAKKHVQDVTSQYCLSSVTAVGGNNIFAPSKKEKGLKLRIWDTEQLGSIMLKFSSICNTPRMSCALFVRTKLDGKYFSLLVVSTYSPSGLKYSSTLQHAPFLYKTVFIFYLPTHM